MARDHGHGHADREGHGAQRDCDCGESFAATADSDRDEFNRLVDHEYDRIRDFLILHYKATERDGSPFWQYTRAMEVPDTLKEKVELFRRRGRVVKHREGIFLDGSWVGVLMKT